MYILEWTMFLKDSFLHFNKLYSTSLHKSFIWCIKIFQNLHIMLVLIFTDFILLSEYKILTWRWLLSNEVFKVSITIKSPKPVSED